MPKDKPMTLADLPDKARPEEFLTDARLLELYQREHDAADDADKPVLAARLRQAKVAAALTEAATAGE